MPKYSQSVNVNKKLLEQIQEKLVRLAKLEKVAKAAVKVVTGVQHPINCKCEIRLQAALIESGDLDVSPVVRSS